MPLKFSIKNRPEANCIMGMIIFVVVERLLESFGAPHSIIFLLDICNIYLFLNILYSKKTFNMFITPMALIHYLLFGIGVVVAVINGVGVALIIWAVRNLIRFYVFFAACISYLNQKDVDLFYDMLIKILYVNIFIVIIQYAIGYRDDFLGGLFGTFTGASTYSNILHLLVCSYVAAKWLEKREKIVKVILVNLCTLFIAIITETKVMLFEVVIIVLLDMVVIAIVERKYAVLFKGMVIGVFALVGIVFGAKYIARLYPTLSNSDFLSVEGLKYILTRESGYSGYGDLNRLTAIKTLNKLPLFGDFKSRLLGLGLGAAEYSSNISIFQSYFYKEYEYLHYYWFSHAWMYIELGYVGLVGYMAGFFANIVVGIKTVRVRKTFCADNASVITGMVMCILSLMLYLYNQSLRIESAYLIYFSIAAIYIGKKEIKQCRKDQV